MMGASTKKVFISYSWAVQAKVIELAQRLISNGIDVLLDVYDLKEGQDKYAFMEQSVNNPEVDRVLIICDETYKIKADNRASGVGDETVIISPEVYGKVKQEKYIPIAVEADEDGHAYIPAYIKSRIYIDLTTEDDRYEAEYEKLLRNIYEAPLYKKPALGKKPDWIENEAVDLSTIRDLIKQIRGYTGGRQAKADFLLRKASDEFVDVAKQFQVSEDVPFEEGLISAIDQTKCFRDTFLDYLESLIYSGLPVSNTIWGVFERLYNELHDVGEARSYSSSAFELYDYIIWELFITTTAVLLHFERYVDIHSLLTHTFFLKHSPFDSSLESHSFLEFRKVFQTIEKECKCKSSEPKRYTMSGDILIKRERKPILTKETISNADIFLYQMGLILKVEVDRGNYWFPTTYVYHREPQTMWQRLKSKEYCEKVLPLFGAKSVEEMKKMIGEVLPDPRMRYAQSYEYAPVIVNNIDIDEIGSLN